MKRLLLSSTTRCPFRCKYCFAQFSQYQRQPTLEDIASSTEDLSGVEVLYPACDDDVFAHAQSIELLRKATSLGCSISVSTKAVLQENVVTQLEQISSEMLKNGSILKIGISFSTRAQIGEIEPGTAKYEQRLRNLRLLSSRGIAVSLNLKPLLEEVPLDEYFAILQDCGRWTDFLLIGQEYLDIEDRRPESNVVTREVLWLRDSPTWPVIEDSLLAKRVRIFANSLGYRCFNSDLPLMADLKQRLSQKDCSHVT